MPETNAGALSETRPQKVDVGNGYSRTAADLPPGMTGQNAMPPTAGAGASSTETSADSTRVGDGWLIAKSLDIYTNSTDYLNANITLGWERNLYHFRNEHAPGTAYLRQDWKRSRTFRPKTRSNVKAQEASHAAAAFTTQDYLDAQPYDQTNERQVLSAAIAKALMQYRLETDIPWFLTSQGAYQDTKVYGICVSHQYWKYEQDEQIVPAFDDTGLPITQKNEDTGEDVAMGESKITVRHDKPCCDLVEPENFRFDPLCDWRRPHESSPYLVYLWPLYAGEARQMMEKVDPKTGQTPWRKYSIQDLLATRKENVDNRTRRAREGHHRIDPTNQRSSDEFTMLWAHLNIVREAGVDIAWWTMGCELVLTDPVPLTEMYPHLAPGERPFVVGFSTIEAHRNYPDGDVAQSAPIQAEINDIANQRLDNVKLVLNKRYFVRRGSQIDLDALMRNVPGGGVMVNDPEKDVNVIPTPDVTGSSYQEQDRLSSDFDELVGSFNQSTIAKGDKTVDRTGAMDQLQGAAGAVQDYGVKIFFETWMEPVLRQLVKMEQMYETDQVVLATAAKKTNLWIKYGSDQVTDDLLSHNLIVRVNVGLGNTDPVKRVQKLTFGMQNVASLPGMAQRIKSTEVANEIFGSLGYKDASRFFMNDQELAEYQKKNPPQPPPEIAVKLKQIDVQEQDVKLRDAREHKKIDNDYNLGMQTLTVDKDLGEQKLDHSTGIAAAKNRTQRDTVAAKTATDIAKQNMDRAHSASQGGGGGGGQ